MVEELEEVVGERRAVREDEVVPGDSEERDELVPSWIGPLKHNTQEYYTSFFLKINFIFMSVTLTASYLHFAVQAATALRT